MNSEKIIMCIVALILGMLLANMLKNVCGCKLMEGQYRRVCCRDRQQNNFCDSNQPQLPYDSVTDCSLNRGHWLRGDPAPPPTPPPAPPPPMGSQSWAAGPFGGA